MPHISIVVPYDRAEKETSLWAEAEQEIDFRRDRVQACRCTTAFAAMELKRTLSRTLTASTFSFTTSPPDSGLTIDLQFAPAPANSGGFTLEPRPDGVSVIGCGRAGLLYGVYELLRMQGWRWYAPGAGGEIAPELTDRLILPTDPVACAPSMTWRGFDFEHASMESAELLLWMARNRMNVFGWRPVTGALGRKLGMTPRVGGHIFEEILAPDRVLSSGKTLWEAHENWYGLPAGGIRRKETALHTQFCVSNPELLEFLGTELLKRLMGQWYEADIVDIWGFDTWGNTCACPSCESIGASTDQILHFLSQIRHFLDRMCEQGRLDHDVQLVICAYEGNSTIAGPSRPVPTNILDAGDCCIFYPIKRCYAHDFADSSCAQNAFYAAALASWFRQTPAMPLIVGEYYNVSKWEDLPVLFANRMKADMPHYSAAGATGMTYMHLPMVNWGMRTITQLLHAQLAWDIETDVEQVLQAYFRNWYGPHAEEMAQAYEMVEKAWCHIGQWRSWAEWSVLSQLLAWDGTRPAQALPVHDHFPSVGETIRAGRQSVQQMQAAQKIIDAVHERECIRFARSALPQGAAVNPIEARRLEQQNQVETRLGEDRRSLIYGIDSMTLMTELLAYHDALWQNDDAAAEEVWARVTQAAEALDSYYVPISFAEPRAGLASKDGLTRSQLRNVLRLCRRYRLQTEAEKNRT